MRPFLTLLLLLTFVSIPFHSIHADHHTKGEHATDKKSCDDKKRM